MSQLVFDAENLTMEDLSSLMADENISFKKRMEVLLEKLVIEPLTEQLDKLIRTRRQILWSA